MPGPVPARKADLKLAYALLAITPALFASNMLTARLVHDFVPPVGLAFWRWLITFLLLLPWVGRDLWRQRHQALAEWRDMLVLGALGIGVCGAVMYVGAATTPASNIGLIYSASPILIVLIAGVFYGERLTRRQGVGIALSLVGVLAIIAKGQPGILFSLDFTEGDLWVLCSTIAWALYAILQKYRPSRLGVMTRFAAIILGGLVMLLPFYLWEMTTGRAMRADRDTILAVLFLACVASFGAYQAYAWIQNVLGAARTGLLMYLVPLYTSGLGYVLLDEPVRLYHLLGAALVLPGIYLATVTRR
ncbi:MAG: DMT family transporter [Alphaproteobacteria bacterium]|nr:DMT family transporter [Alphaproteobacteria bacterium]MBU0795845.1 DMT family transporter [Alphaproteobacteria bacterium]MBU0885747.1 DMT family transporter [Alphaproteobacteria bacterium]MBU1814450.1 DMT family transporter [Alphaproteobacteria bacterium]